MTRSHFPLDPHVRVQDFGGIFATPDWDVVDRIGSELIGHRCIGVPSVRVALTWIFEHRGLSRHRDHVLVPRFVSRCILASLQRQAFPVEDPTPRTRLAIVVHQYGFRQDLDAVAAECARRSLLYIEDAAYGPDAEERLGPGSYARIIGLTKTLPVLKGGLLLTEDPLLVDHIRRRRAARSFWSMPVLIGLAALRSGLAHGAQSLAEAVYELYHASGGDNFVLVGNVVSGLRRFADLSAESSRRRDHLMRSLQGDIVVSTRARTPYLAAYFPQDAERTERALRVNGFEATIYHIDRAFNLFAPHYERGYLIPFNPRIPRAAFESLVSDLRMDTTAATARTS